MSRAFDRAALDRMFVTCRHCEADLYTAPEEARLPFGKRLLLGPSGSEYCAVAPDHFHVALVHACDERGEVFCADRTSGNMRALVTKYPDRWSHVTCPDCLAKAPLF